MSDNWELSILTTLHEEGPMTSSHLASVTGLTGGRSMGSKIGGLVRKGAIEETEEGFYGITPLGEEKLQIHDISTPDAATQLPKNDDGEPLGLMPGTYTRVFEGLDAQKRAEQLQQLIGQLAELGFCESTEVLTVKKTITVTFVIR